MGGVPESVVIPFVGMDFDSSRAQQGPSVMPFSVLIIGQKVSGGTGTANTLTQIFSVSEAETLAGLGSMAHAMARRFFDNNKITDCYMILLDDAVGSQATRTITFAGPATADGEIAIYVNGTRIAFAVASGDTATDIGDAFVAAYAKYDYLPWTAANVIGTVTMTATNDGVAAGDNDMRYNIEPSEFLPTGVTVTIGTTTAGTVDPDVQDALDAIGDKWFNIIINPYDDATNMDAVETYLASKFGPIEQKDGVAYQAKRDTTSNLITFATNSSRNSQSAVLIDAGSRMCATWELAAGVAGAVAASAQDDPAVPLHRITLQGFRPNLISERRLFTERNNLANNGVMTLSDDNGLQTEATVTMYLKNSAGAADIAYEQQNTMFQLMRLRYRFVNQIKSRYPRAKLMSDSRRVRAGQQIITPEIGRLEAISWFIQEEIDGQVEGIDQFKDEIVCERSSTNPNRLEWLLSPDLVNQFIVGSATMQFLL